MKGMSCSAYHLTSLVYEKPGLLLNLLAIVPAGRLSPSWEGCAVLIPSGRAGGRRVSRASRPIPNESKSSQYRPPGGSAVSGDVCIDARITGTNDHERPRCPAARTYSASKLRYRNRQHLHARVTLGGEHHSYFIVQFLVIIPDTTAARLLWST